MSKDNKQKETSTPTPAAKPEIYHFAGGGEYEPVSIEAVSQEEALEKWEKIRKPVARPESTSADLLPLQDKDVVE